MGVDRGGLDCLIVYILLLLNHYKYNCHSIIKCIFLKCSCARGSECDWMGGRKEERRDEINTAIGWTDGWMDVTVELVKNIYSREKIV